MKRAPLALLLVACSGSSETHRVNLRLNLSENCFTCQTADDCIMDCGGQIAVYVVDPVTGASIDDGAAPDARVVAPGAPDAGDVVLAERCIDFGPAADQKLRSLPTLLRADGLQFDFPAGTRVAFEVYVYFNADGDCRRASKVDGLNWYDDSGDPAIYAGRSAVYTLEGGDVTVDVPLDCTIFVESCSSKTSQITAYLQDIEDPSAPLLTEQATSLRMHYAYLNYDGMGPYSAFFNPSIDLDINLDAPNATFEANTDGSFGVGSCIGTIVTTIAGGLTASIGSCEGEQSFEPPFDTFAVNYYITPERVDQILTALGLSDLPPQGLLVGRVMNGGQPVYDATLRPLGENSTATVVYLEEDASSTLQLRSSGSWFVVTDAQLQDPFFSPEYATCCENFVAESPSVGVPLTTPPTGLVRGVIMATSTTL